MSVELKPDTKACAPLYEGERLESVAGFTTLFKYLPSTLEAEAGGKQKPLIVFIPGAAHLARIAYGGHSGYHPEDFLAYWLNKEGFDVLAVSYPLESQPTIIPPEYPNFRIPAWGEQAAKTARLVVDEHGRNGISDIILLAWSMGGKILKPFITSARTCGLNVKLFVSLAATPGGIRGLGPAGPYLGFSETGYCTFPGFSNVFLRWIQEQRERHGSKVTLDDNVYVREYCGNVPACLTAGGFRVKSDNNDQKKAPVPEEWEGLRDAGPTSEDLRGYPFIGIVRPTSPSDLPHTLADTATWGMVLTHKLVADIQASPNKGYQDYPDVWQQLSQLVYSAPEQMTVSITGNHFFFLGEKGARETAQAVTRLVERMGSIQSQMDGLLQKH